MTLRPEFENMLGFTQSRADALLDEIYKDCEIDPGSQKEVGELIRTYYNGYHFVNPGGGGCLQFNHLMFSVYFIEIKAIPKHLIDLNLRTDISWLRRLTGSDPAYTEELVNRLPQYHTV
ncbi:MAG: AAA family ATPase [Desulfobacterales bacterium]